MTYNVFSGTLNPTHSLTCCDKVRLEMFIAGGDASARIRSKEGGCA